MGYEVVITRSNAAIKAAHKPAVLQIWKDLNKPENDHLKNGGSYSQGGKTSSWYSWMDADYDTKCNSVEDVLGELGFSYEVMADGETVITGYDRKIGQEQLFFDAVAPFVSGSIDWEGEDGCDWTWNFDWNFDGRKSLNQL
jgi:hypothetical protein